MKKRFLKYWPSLLSCLFGLQLCWFGYGCESKTNSLLHSGAKVNRVGLNFELNTLMQLAQIRKADLDRQDKLRKIILDNAIQLAQGNETNPIGILTGILSIYGISTAGKNATAVVKSAMKKKIPIDPPASIA